VRVSSCTLFTSHPLNNCSSRFPLRSHLYDMTDHATPDAQAIPAAQFAAVEDRLDAERNRLTAEHGLIDPSHLVGTKLEVDVCSSPRAPPWFCR